MPLLLRGQTTDFQDAVSALKRSDWPAAEQKLRAELSSHPDEAEAMSLLGVALDNQQKYAEADGLHRKAMDKAAGSPSLNAVLRNYANHLLLSGDSKGARELFLKAVAIDPSDSYANLQLAQVAVKSGNGQEALQYLERLPAEELDSPNVAVLRLVALDLAKNVAEADALVNRLAAATENDAGLSASLGLKLVQAGQFEQGEIFLTHALAADPTNFSALYQLGVVASRAGHNDRAREVLENALRRQPENVDAMYALAFVYNALKQPEQAVRLLAQAARLAPQRADVQKLLAVTTGDLHAYDDSVAAWDRYVKLQPDDDAGRRERGFAMANIKQAEAGLSDLEWYAGRHPEDPLGLFELGLSQSVNDPEKGLATLDKAVALKPDYVEARSARGALEYQLGKAEPALSDLEFAASKLPDSAMVLDRLGQTYLLLDRLPDALRVLRRAAELAPGDAKTQLHVANALAQAGQTEVSRLYMNRYRELGGSAAVPARGVIDYLNLTPEQQHAAYRARIEKGLLDHPADATILVSYLKLSIADRQMDVATATARKIEGIKPGAIILADAGRAMLAAGQYGLAKELLEQAAAADPAAGLEVDLATAGFHADGPAAGLRLLESVPAGGRGSDYYVARAQMLEASGQTDQAMAALVLAVKAEPVRPDLYWRAAAMMTKNHHTSEALQLLDQAATTLPQEVQIPVTRAVVLELSGKTEDALHALADAQHRWPEAAAVWAAQGMILAAHQHPEEARKALDTAVALGAHSPEVWYALAGSSLGAGPERLNAARTAIDQAVKIAPEDAEVRALAARLASGMGAAATGDFKVDPAKLLLSRPPVDW